MNNFALDKKSWGQSAQITPIVHGLLAESTGNEDNPYRSGILKSLTSKEGLDGFDPSTALRAGKLTTSFAGSAKNAEKL